MTEGVKLKPCPFCGNEKPILWHLTENFYHVACAKCGAKSMRGVGESEASERWNNRTPTPQGGKEGDEPPSSLPPCPYCNYSRKLVVCESPRRGWHVRCLECGAQGPTAETDGGAADVYRMMLVSLPPAVPAPQVVEAEDIRDAKRVINDLCSALESLMNKEKFHELDDANYAYNNACRWLANAPLSEPPQAEAGEAEGKS